MIDHADNIIDLNAILHPGSVYDHPRDVVADQTISLGEKRAILASWASDAAAVASNPALRELPGSRRLVTIEGHKADKAEHEYLYRGISARPFKRQFNLADYVQVRSAAFENGLLKIELFREIPEAMKPRRIAINGAAASNVHQLEGKAA